MAAVNAKIIPSAKGPVVICEDLILHMTDTQGLAHAVDTTPMLLQDLEKSLLDHFGVVTNFVRENLVSKHPLQPWLVIDAINAMNDFFIFAYQDYIGFLRLRVLDTEPGLSGEKLDAAVRRANRGDVNDFYALKRS